MNNQSKNKTQTISQAFRDILPVIEEWIRFISYYHDIPGVSMAIQQYDKLLSAKAFGKSNLNTGEKLSTDHLFRIASHSKLFTATAIMELYAQEKLSLDDKIIKYLPWIKLKNSNIRIHHLLTHSSGITRDSDFGQWYHYTFPDREELKEITSDDIEVLEPSEQIKYSNVAYSLLGLIIEQLTGESYEKYMLDLIKRLGLQFTFPNLGDRAEQHAVGHDIRLPGEPRDIFDHIEAKAMDSATGFSSVPSDLLKFYRAQMLNQEKSLKYDNYFKREMQNLQFEYKTTKWGYGFIHYSFNDTLFLGHSGGYPGFITLSGFNPDKELSIALFTNTGKPPIAEMFTGIVSFLQFAENRYSTFNDDKKHDLSKYEGFYRFRDIMLVKQFHNQLIVIPVITFTPTIFYQRLQMIESDTFIIREASPTSFKGEKVYFRLGDQGKEFSIAGIIYKEYSYNY